MSSLAHWQRDFLAGLFGDEESQGLEVYRRNVLANLHDALAAAYPVVRRLVGEAFFREAADRFARDHPSRSGDLNRYGAELAPFLESYPYARALAYLPDVARLEWACVEAFHAGDGKRLDFHALAAIAQDDRGRIRLRLHPAVRLIESAHAILAMWEANQPGCEGTPARLEGPDHVLVRRAELAVRASALSPPEWHFLGSVRRGATLDELADDACIASTLEQQLTEWTANGVIDDFELSSPR